jgi:hypothetical protein
MESFSDHWLGESSVSRPAIVSEIVRHNEVGCRDV